MIKIRLTVIIIFFSFCCFAQRGQMVKDAVSVLDLAQPANTPLLNLVTTEGDSVSIVHVLETQLRNNELRAYLSRGLKDLMPLETVNAMIGTVKNLQRICLAERWDYDDRNKKMKIAILGIGLCGTNGGTQPTSAFLWISYEDFINGLTDYTVRTDDGNISCAVYFSDRYFKSELVEVDDKWKSTQLSN